LYSNSRPVRGAHKKYGEIREAKREEEKRREEKRR
jgi:hypothetical protein